MLSREVALVKGGKFQLGLPFASSTAVIFAPGCTRSTVVPASWVCTQRLPVQQNTAKKTQALCGWHRDGDDDDDDALFEPLPAHRAALSQHFIAGAAEQEQVTNGFLQKRNPACSEATGQDVVKTSRCLTSRRAV